MSVVRELVKKADASTDIADEVKEALKLMMELAESKAQVFQKQIENDLLTGKTMDNLTIPITKVVRWDIQYRATTSDTPNTDPLKVVTQSISDMIQDHSAQGIVSGISNICMGVVDTLMGIGKGEEQVIEKYLVTADYPAIVRLDFRFWCRKISATSIRKKCETVFSYVCSKSAVDISKLSFNDFLSVYSQVLRAGFGDDPSKLKEMVEQSKEIYRTFNFDNVSGRASMAHASMEQLTNYILNNRGPATIKVYPAVNRNIL